MKLSAAVLCFGVLFASAYAQTSSGTDSKDQTPTFQAGGEEVVLDVVVRDKKNKFIKDLKPTDFTIIDNGDSHPVKSFRLVEGTDSVSSSGARAQLDPLRQIRLVTLIFHGLDDQGRRTSRQAAMDLIKSDLGQNVYLSVMTIDHRLEAIQTFTNDRELLRKAIERATGGANDFSGDNSRVRDQLQQLVGTFQGGDSSLAAQVGNMGNGATGTTGPNSAPQGPAAADQAMAQMMFQIVTSSQDDAAMDWGRASIFSLLTAVKDQYRLPGRKTILFFSPGFSIPQGMEEPFRNVISIANRSNVSFYAIDARGLTTTSTQKDSNDVMRSAMASAAANTGSGKVVTTDMAKSEDRALDAGTRNTQDTLLRLAKETGGDLIANTNDFRAPIRRLNEDIETYYELSYDPQIQKYDGTFRKVAVKTDDAQLRVQSRSGYFALPPSLTKGGQVVAGYEVPLLKALDEKPVPRTFAFQSTGMHFRDAAGAPGCDVVVDIPISSVTLTKNPTTAIYEGQFAYVALVKDRTGQIVKKFRNEIPLKITAEQLAGYQAGHFIEPHYFELQPGRYTLETAVVDMGGEKLSARKTSFMVPVANSDLSISSVAMVRNLKPADPKSNNDNPLKMENQIIEPTVSPTLKKSETSGVPFYVVVYSDKTNTEKPSLTMEFSRDGQTLGKSSAPLNAPDAQGRIHFMTTVPVAQLEPGNYQVRMITTQGKEAAAESVTFTLEP